MTLKQTTDRPDELNASLNPADSTLSDTSLNLGKYQSAVPEVVDALLAGDTHAEFTRHCTGGCIAVMTSGPSELDLLEEPVMPEASSGPKTIQPLRIAGQEMDIRNAQPSDAASGTFAVTGNLVIAHTQPGYEASPQPDTDSAKPVLGRIGPQRKGKAA